MLSHHAVCLVLTWHDMSAQSLCLFNTFEVNNVLAQSINDLCSNPANPDFVKVLKCKADSQCLGRLQGRRIPQCVDADSLWQCHIWLPAGSPCRHPGVRLPTSGANLALGARWKGLFLRVSCQAGVLPLRTVQTRQQTFWEFCKNWWNSELNIGMPCWMFFVFYSRLIVCYS